jgi:hypothetical protein
MRERERGQGNDRERVVEQHSALPTGLFSSLNSDMPSKRHGAITGDNTSTDDRPIQEPRQHTSINKGSLRTTHYNVLMNWSSWSSNVMTRILRIDRATKIVDDDLSPLSDMSSSANSRET